MSGSTPVRSWLGGALIGVLALLCAPAAAAPPTNHAAPPLDHVAPLDPGGPGDPGGPSDPGGPGDPLDPGDPDDPAGEAPIEVELDAITPAVIRPGDELSFSGRIVNNTDDELTSAVVWVRMQRHVPTDDGLSRWLDGESNTNIAVIARLRLSDPDDDRARFEVTLGEGESPFTEGSTWGPHGVEIVAETNLGDAGTRSVMTWFPSHAPEGSPASFTALAPLQPTVGEWSRALESDTTLAAASSERLRGVTGALHDAPVTWAVDPVLLESVAVSTTDVSTDAGSNPSEPTDPSESSGSAEPAPDATSPAGTPAPPELEVAAIAAAVTEVAAGRPVIDLGYGAPDYEALLGEGTVAGERLLTHGGDRSAALFEAAGLATIPRTVWPAVELSEPTRQALAAEHDEILRTPTRTSTSAYTSTPGLDLASLTGNYTLSAGILTAHTAEDERELIARSALAVRATPEVPIVLTLPRALSTDQAVRAAENLTGLAELPWFTPRDLTDQTETPLSLRPDGTTAAPEPSVDTAGALTAAKIASLAADADRVLTIAALTDDPASFSGGYLPELLGAAAASWREDPPRRTELIAGVHERAMRLTSAITVETPSTINLISRGGEVPITIANSLPQAVTVEVRLEPGDARLRADERVSGRLPAEAAATVRVPVHAVANGNVRVSVHVLDAQGHDVAEPISFSIRVRADWEDTGTAIVAAGLLALFLFGLVRTIRRGRRRREG
ncbi:hypothetical protein GCG21_12560 [Pseudactinotalea sp. HY160]|uniref:DUF6049 family protein n=1 Tax=Pseudactinotalea sp. HY160 TaxID=2654490 RepID=UPI00128E14C2|nr:hypothetical protein [Pseudactinotalea sp. HY160]